MCHMVHNTSKYLKSGEQKKPHTLWKHLTAYSYHSYSCLSFFLVNGQDSQKSMVSPIEQFLTSRPRPLTYDLDLKSWPRYPSTWPPCKNSCPYVCPFRWYSETDRRTDTHTDTQCQNYYTHHVRDVGCNKIMQLVYFFLFFFSCLVSPFWTGRRLYTSIQLKNKWLVTFFHEFHKNLCDMMRAAVKKAALKKLEYQLYFLIYSAGQKFCTFCVMAFLWPPAGRGLTLNMV